jgi:ATP-binding cassette subfamily F protein 3
VRTALGAFLFSGEDVFKSVKDLSGGEKVRLALCKIFKRKPNILILDEPTNHMDIIGKETLEKILLNYQGTVVIVSHDRYFINKVCDSLAVLGKDGVSLYECTYSEYEEKIKSDPKVIEISACTERKETTKKAPPVSKEKEKNKKIHRISVLEEKIGAIDEKISEIRKRIDEDETVYLDYTKVAELQEQIDGLEAEEAPFMEEWERLMAEISEN